MKKIIIIFIILITLAIPITYFLFFQDSDKGTITVIDVVTKEGIEGARIKIITNFFCYESMNKAERKICSGEYKVSSDLITDSNGKASVHLRIPLRARFSIADFRFNVVPPPNYNENPSYGFLDDTDKIVRNPVVRLIPKSAPIGTSQVAVEYAKTLPEIKDLIDKYGGTMYQ